MDDRRSGILAAGNFIVDHVKLIDRWPTQDSLAHIGHEARFNGGGPYNLLKDLGRLGARFPLSACGLVGDDSDGRWILQDCGADGIDTTGLRATTEAPTSFTDVMTVRADGRRTFFHFPGANALLAPLHFDFSTSRARIFYLGYLLLLERLDALDGRGQPAARAVFAHASAAGLVTVLDCVSDASGRFTSVVEPVLPEVDILFANDFEAEQLTGLSLGRGSDLDPAAVEAAARALVRKGVRRHACIHFPEGACVASTDGSVVWQPAVALPPHLMAGASGAGDAFAAGALFGYHEHWPLDQALQLGACTAAASVRHPSCSTAIESAEACLELGRRFGYLALP